MAIIKKTIEVKVAMRKTRIVLTGNFLKICDVYYCREYAHFLIGTFLNIVQLNDYCITTMK